MTNDLTLLDCTLRDGGYVNDWKWGFSRARAIIRALVRARVDVVEVGFLRDVERYDRDITVCNTIEELNRLLPLEHGSTKFSAMAMRSNYDIEKLCPYNGEGIEIIRITAHDYDLLEGLEFAKRVKEKGYKLSINPINIMGYTDEQILHIVERVNDILPYQFSIVDTFGSMKRRDMERIVGMVDNNLDRRIRVALHLHENMSLSTCLAQNFADMHLQRPVAIDASLMGMGRIPGNLPIELISDYLNEHEGKHYDIDFMMDAIEEYVSPLKGQTQWGYTPAYYLSARFNLHRNYAEYYIGKGDLTNRDINHILARIDRKKATVFDQNYAESLYHAYKGMAIDDRQAREQLRRLFKGRTALILAPGYSIKDHLQQIRDFVKKVKPLVIAINFLPDEFMVDYVFITNNKRLNRLEQIPCKAIVTSNLSLEKAEYVIDYNSLCGAFDQGCNSLIMVLKLLKELSVKEAVLAGADGYQRSGENYYDSSIRSHVEHDAKFNNAVASALKRLELPISFLTPSAYDHN